MARKKGNAKGAANQSSRIPQLVRRLEALANKPPAPQPSGKKKKRNRNKKKTNRVSHGATMANFHPFARGFLDPFGARGVRVPDSVLVRTATTSVRWYGGGAGGTPIYNYANATVYGTVLAAPLAGLSSDGGLPLHYSFTPSGANSYFDYSGNASPFTPDFSKTWGDGQIGYNLMPFDPKSGKSYRVAGGGVKLIFYNIGPMVNADVYAIPMFNGDSVSSDYASMNSKRIKHYSLSGNDEIVLPIPMRHIGEAFEWIDSSKTGYTTASFPGDDNMSGNVTFGSYVKTASTNCTTTNTAIKAWSPQSGLGGWQIAFTLPQNAGFRCELMLHFEVMANSSVGPNYFQDSDLKPSYANASVMETVANVVGHDSITETVRQGGIETPWQEFTEKFGNATSSAIAGKLVEPMLERVMSGITG